MDDLISDRDGKTESGKYVPAGTRVAVLDRFTFGFVPPAAAPAVGGHT